jgi:hypothetical protein
MKCEFTISDTKVEVESFSETEFHILVDGDEAYSFVRNGEQNFYLGEDQYKILWIDSKIALCIAEVTWHLVAVKELS